MRSKITSKVRRLNSLKLWSAITGVALVVALVLTFLPMQVSVNTDGLLSISLSPGQTQAQGEPGAPAYQVLIPTEMGSETGLQVFPPKLQDGGTKTNWLAVQNPQGLDVPVGTMILDEDGAPVGINASIGDIYIDPTTDYLIISPYALSDKCSKQIDITNYTTRGNETVWDENLGKNVTTPLRAKFRSYVYGSGSDTYQLENCPQRWDARNLTVASVTIYAIVRGTDSKSTASTRINTATKKYNGGTVNLGISNDTRIETLYTLNPNTRKPWTWEEIDELEAGVTLKTAECSYVYVLVETEVHSQTFYPITPVEVTPGSASSWVDVNCSSYIASGATGVVFHVVNTNGSTDYNCGYRKNGSTDWYYSSMYLLTHTWGLIGVDADRTFEAYVGSTTSIDLYLVGYTMSGVTFQTNATDKSLVSTLTWTDINCSVQAPSAIGLIFHQYYPSVSDVRVGMRKNGSTDARITYVYKGTCPYMMIGCDGSQIAEGYISSASQDFYLVGYVTAGATFNTNATDLSLAGTGAWTDLSAIPSNSSMGFIEVSGGYYNYGLRKNGSSEDIYMYGAGSHHWSFVECDNSWLIEGKISNTGEDFWLIGYAEGTTIVVPTVTTQAATNIGCTNFTANGNITATGGANPTTRGFCYKVGVAGDPTTADSTAYDTGSFGTGAYTKSITGLTPSTYYRVRAYAINSAGTGYGSTVQVTTLPGDPSNLTDTAHAGTSVDLEWTKGTGADYTLIRYRTDQYPTGTSDGTLGYNSTSNTTLVGSLSYGQIYYFRAWAWNSTTTLYSNGTSDRTCYTDPNAPTSFVVTETTCNSTALSWVKGTGADWTKIQYRTDQYPTTYTDGTQAYNSTGTSVNITGLDSGQIYYIRAWSYDTESGYYDSYAQLLDYTLPGNPSALGASNPTATTIDVSWAKGTGGDKTMVRYAKGAYPEYGTGTQLYFDTGTSQQATSLDPTSTYYFRCWSYDSDSGYHSSGYSSDTETTLCAPEITNIPDNWDFGVLELGTTSNTAINYFTLNNTGNCAVDVTIQGTDLTSTSPCLSFDGNSDYVNIGTLGDFGSNMESGRIEFWFREPSGKGGYVISLDNDNGMYISIESDDILMDIWDEDDLLDFRTDTYAFDDDTWHYAEIEWDCSANTITITVDSEICDGDYGVQQSPETFANFTEDGLIGNQAITYYWGLLDDIKLYDSTGLIAYWSMDEGLDSTIYDSIGDNDGTIYGASWSTRPDATWDLADDATPGENIYGLYTGLDDADDLFDVIVRETATYNTLVSDLAEDATQAWGLKIYMPTSVSGYDAQQMSGTITLVASESS